MKKSIKTIALSCFITAVAFSAYAACTATYTLIWTDSFGNKNTTTSTVTRDDCNEAMSDAKVAAWTFRREHIM